MKKVECYDISQRGDVFRECKGAPTLCARMGTGGNNVPIVLMDQGGDVMTVEHDKVGTLRAQTHGHEPIVLSHPNGAAAIAYEDGKTGTLISAQSSTPVIVEDAFRISSERSNAMLSDNPHSGINKTNISPTLDTTIPTAAKAQGGLAIVSKQNISFEGCVRRLTPVECERLQGFPDEYTQIPYREKPAEKCPDAPRYKAIGNSWPVPVIRWIGKRIDKVLRGESL